MHKFLSVGLILLTLSQESFAWGKTGHYVVGQIADRRLSKSAQRAINEILRGESLAMVGNYMDAIKSDSSYDHMRPWHYCTIPDSLSYDQAGTPEEGDVIQTIDRVISELQSKQFTDSDEAFALKILVHLIGDIHQPLHVGNGEDRGGNDIRTEFFWQSSNLHRVWDSGIIENQKLSYSEWSDWLLSTTSDDEIKEWENAEVIGWANESKALRDQVYDLPKDAKINYEYEYRNLDVVKQRLLQAGIRLAFVLNSIYN
ncbi:MAG: S1/P1 nuclease [Cyclobacteriaceae bacterium]